MAHAMGKIHWAVLLPGLPAEDYTLRCRTIDEKGQAQPKPSDSVFDDLFSGDGDTDDDFFTAAQ